MPTHRVVSMDELTQYLHLPEKAVAKQLGICLTSLKKLCRQHGITRWPYRKVRAATASCSRPIAGPFCNFAKIGPVLTAVTVIRGRPFLALAFLTVPRLDLAAQVSGQEDCKGRKRLGHRHRGRGPAKARECTEQTVSHPASIFCPCASLCGPPLSRGSCRQPRFSFARASAEPSFVLTHALFLSRREPRS